jgi:predicted O-linked N-acetylglucosamine transferase (SPINDLY family)
LDGEITKLRRELRDGKRVLPPFVGIAVGSSPCELLTAARLWAEDECPTASVALCQGQPYAHDRIRLAYLSANFNEHAVARLMVGVFEHHDKTRFETTAISFGRNDGQMSERLERAFDHFVDVRSKGDAEVAQLLRDMEIDIAVDLMGFTELCRARILAFRPASVQVNYLGFPGTVGAGHLDYIIADKTVIQEGEQNSYSENVVFLPDCYLPNDSTRSIAARTPSRREAGLPERGFVFCSFNQAYKFAPAMFDIWMRLLKQSEGSVLWLPQCAPAAMRNLKEEAVKRGAPAERIVFAPFAPSTEDHLARLRLADLFLDTLPYNSHTSACDALWSGVPVVTYPGTSFAGRVAASVLLAIGLPELVASSLAEYENIAAEFASEPISLAAIKEKIAKHREVYPLFDTVRFTRNLEAAYTAMWQRARRGEAHASFAVAPP